jgi:virginiamycin B lyase
LDGNVWLAEGGAEKLGRVTPGGILSEFDLPDPETVAASGAFDVVSGPDGNLWYVRRGENRIGRLEIPGRRQPVERTHRSAHPRTVPPRP